MKAIALVSLALIAGGCASGRYGPSLKTPVPEGKHTLKNFSLEERQDALRRASVWQLIDTASLDLAMGPPLASGEVIPKELTCSFVFPDKPLSGNTPKFRCEAGPGDVVKVKYGEENGEVYAEIAASRLFWALGFKVDPVYPARVSCDGCPPDPFVSSKKDWRRGRPSAVGRVVFDPAAIARSNPWSSIEVPEYEGWAWPELNTVNAEAGGAPRAHIDALRLLAVFVQHSDSKPEQQDLLCATEGVTRDGAGNETCTAPWLIVKDLGTTFGKATARNNSKMDLDDWSGARIWREGTACVGDLSRSLTGSLEHPRIGEAGREFLASRLLLLRDEQIHDLFEAAMADRRDGTLDDWVRVFKRKRDEIVNARCAP
jgi:hypothetical protein